MKKDFDNLKRLAIQNEVSKLQGLQRDLRELGFLVTIKVVDKGENIDDLITVNIRMDKSVWGNLKKKLKMRSGKTKSK